MPQTKTPPTKSSKPKPKTKRKRPITAEDLLRFTFVSDPQVSPDGTTVLFTQKTVGEKNNYVTNLWTVPAGGGDPVQFTTRGKDGHGRWSPDGSRIAFIRRSDEAPQIHTMAASGGEAHSLTSFPEGSISGFKWSPDGKHLAVLFRETDPDWTKEAEKKRKEEKTSLPPRVLEDVWYRLDGDGYFNHQRHHLYMVDAGTGEAKKVYDKDRLGFISFDWSPDSKQLVLSANTDRRAIFKAWKQALYRLDVKTLKVTKIPGIPDGPKDDVRWSPDGKTIAYAGREGRDDIYSTDNLELWICDPVKGRAKCLTGDEDYCLLAVALSDTADANFGSTIRWAADGKSIYLLLGWEGESHLAVIPIKGGKIRFLTKGAYDHSLGSFSGDGKTLGLVMGTSTRLPEIGVARVSATSATPKRLTDFNRDVLAELEIAKPSMHWVTTADGTRCQVWVMRPPRAPKSKRVPAVLEVHGGPHAMYGVGFFHEFQMLTAAGYAVFYANPRGSKGYGQAHTEAIRGAWGTADWVDIQAVIEFMKRQPFVNPGRMGIMGGSYGGYMTNWAIGHTGAFAGAITDRCVSNLISMSGNSDFPINPDEYWEGNFWDRTEALWKSSPIQYMGSVKTPTLIIHSEGDLRCNIEQSEQVFTLLKYKDVPTRFVRYPRSTSHGMSRGGPPDMRMHRLHQILDWWKKYLG